MPDTVTCLTPPPPREAALPFFLGNWALDLPGGAGWLSLRQEQGYLDADILWYGGSVVPVDNVYFNEGTLLATRNRQQVRKQDANGNSLRTQILTSRIEINRRGDAIIGELFEPKRDGMGVGITSFSGKRIPPIPQPPDLSKITFGEPVPLFNGKDLTGWQLINPDDVNGFRAENGILMNDPVQEEGKPNKNYGNIRTVREFEDFNLKIEVNVPKGSNSGVYLRGIYEVQVSDSYGSPLDSHNMGAIYSRIAPTAAAEKPAGEWQKMDITLCDRHATIFLNGVKIIDNKPLPGANGGALRANEFIPGPIYLQGDHGKVLYRNILLTP